MKFFSSFFQKCTAVLTGFLLLTAPAAVHAEEDVGPVVPEATDLMSSMTVSPETAENASWALNDGNRTTRVSLPAEETLTVTAEKSIYGAYIIWDHAPDSWEILCNGKSIMQSGDNSFLHHYIEFPSACSKFQLITHDDQGILCDIHPFSYGRTPDWVQKWQEPLERADLLVFPTHADDEHLLLGGTIPYYIMERNYRVQVAYLTNHNGEPYRPHELLNGLWTAGVRNYPVIGKFPDYYSKSLEHAKTLYDVNEILAYQTEVIRRFKPYVVVGHDLGGEYGHGVHMLNAHGLQEIAPKTGDPAWCPESAEKYGVWELPKLYLHLYPENEIRMDWYTPLESMGGKSPFEISSDAFACHVSQQVFIMERSGKFDTTRYGLAYTSVGPDIQKNDMFENIRFDPEPLPEESSEPESSLPAPEPEPVPEASEESSEAEPESVPEIPPESNEEETADHFSLERTEISEAPSLLIGLSAIGAVLLAALTMLLFRRKK